ncbi:uncharacterized protein LOC129717191 [Wyeomyia smithii]|uniref:uncharacterized protein LOC129717191 n=1 Tax=Wyeomyia smithii TaxID=174621 RepID=UPI002467BDBD|nr:uncharacterized protein LOC129717191 [Wyeomyia smithii]
MASSAGLKPPKPIVLGDNMAAQWKSWIRQYSWFATATQLSDKPAEVQAATFMGAIGEDFDQLAINLRPSKTKWLISFSNHKLKVLGEINPVCKIKHKSSSVTFKVVEESVVPLLGRETCIAQRLIARVDTVQISDNILYDGLGCVQNYVYDIDLIPNPQWETRPARHVPHSIRTAVKKELDSMERLGVIEKIHVPTPVVSAMVLVKRKEKLRICIDSSQGIGHDNNQHSDTQNYQRINASDKELLATAKVQFAGPPSSTDHPIAALSAPKLINFRKGETINSITSQSEPENTAPLLGPMRPPIVRLTEQSAAGDKRYLNARLRDHKIMDTVRTFLAFLHDQPITVCIRGITKISASVMLAAEGLPTDLNLLREIFLDVHEELGISRDDALADLQSQRTSLSILKYYDVNDPVTLSVDASSHALGAVLPQDGHPIAYASKALTPSEKNYPQIEKEVTDIRLRRIRLEVSQYNPKVIYVKGTNIPIPDILSRDVDNIPNDNKEEHLEVHVVLQMTKTASKELRQHSEADLEIRSLKATVMQGWPETRDELLPELKKYWCFRDEMAVNDMLVFKSNQVLIPQSLRKDMLAKVHSGHSGIQSCETNLILDRGKEYLLLIDSHSGYFDIKQLPETTSRYVIEQLKEWFSVHGVPQVLETDNGPQNACKEFREFCGKWEFDHQTSSPHFPRANGLAERYVQVAKAMLKKYNEDQSDVRLALLHMRNTPRSSCIPSPNERLMGRLVRSNMPMTLEALKPRVAINFQQLLERERETQKNYADRGAKEPPQFVEQEQILIQDRDSQK